MKMKVCPKNATHTPHFHPIGFCDDVFSATWYNIMWMEREEKTDKILRVHFVMDRIFGPTGKFSLI